jgi:creatinine amidohydrolase
VPDLYFKEKEQMRAYLTEHKIAIDQHASTDDTSEVMFIDTENRWIRRDKLIDGKGTDGVTGDQTKATPELGKMFINYKVQDAVEQIRQLLK